MEKLQYEYLPLNIEDTWGILVNTKHSLAKKAVVTPSDIEANPIVVSNQSFIDNQLASWLGEHFEQLNVIGRYNLLYNASLLAKENIASILCIDGIINTKNTNLKFIPFSPPLTAGISIVWKKNQTFSSASKEFLRLIKKNLLKINTLSKFSFYISNRNVTAPYAGIVLLSFATTSSIAFTYSNDISESANFCGVLVGFSRRIMYLSAE